MDQRVAVIGLWHLGVVYAACLAKLGCKVTGIDENREVVSSLNKGRAPLYETDLDPLVADGLSKGNLGFTSNFEDLSKADCVVIAYDTPVDEQDKPDISIVMDAADRIGEYASHSALIIVSSQVPVGTCEKMIQSIAQRRKGVTLQLAYVPENLRLGTAIQRFLRPDMIVVGANDPETRRRVREFFSSLETKFVEMDLRSAEMTKHALNCFLATSVSFANEIGNICDLVGADGLKIAEALKCDSRIGSRALLRPGLGFSGGTLARDMKVLQDVGDKNGYDTFLLDGVLALNQRQNASIINKLRIILGDLNGLTIAVLGLTYKAGTSTLRRSVALEIMEALCESGVNVKCYDPKISKDGVPSKFQFTSTVYEAAEGADAMLVLNDWPEFFEIDFQKILQSMRRPIVVDAQNLLYKMKVDEQGFKYYGIGRGMDRTSS